MEYLKEEMQTRKRGEVNSQSDLNHFKKETERLQAAVEKLTWYKQEYTNLTRANSSLKQDLSGLKDQFESMVLEKADLESHTKEVIEELNEEKKARSELADRLREEALYSPTRMSWMEESADHLIPESVSPQMNGHMAHSTPYTAKSAGPSLLSELQNSLLSSVGAAEMDSIQQKLREAEEDKKNLLLQITQLQKELQSHSGTGMDMDQWKEEAVEENRKEIGALKEELASKSDEISQLKGKFSSIMNEKASLEIELDGLRDEIKRERTTNKLKLDKHDKELTEELSKSEAMKSKLEDQEKELVELRSKVEKLEVVLTNSSEELITMRDEMKSLHRTVLSLNQNGKVDSSHLNVNGDISSTEENSSSSSSSDTYTIVLQNGTRMLQVHKESHTLLSAMHLRDQLCLLRGPLEQFTRTMLQRSLAVSTRHISTSTEQEKSEDNNDNKKINELENEIKKLKTRLMTRSEEASQLRTIMKARQTTVDVTISSLKSKLEGQGRAHDTEVVQLKHKIKTLRKERDDKISLMAMTARRCQDHMEEITRYKKKAEDLRADNEKMKTENKLVNMYLDRAIRQKIEISVLLEQYQEEEERTKMIPMALSSSRV